MNYYPHHIGDYRADTAHLSLLEHGVYRQLLDWYYLDEQPIPSETQVVFRRLAARTEVDQLAIVSVLSDFFSLTEQGYKHTRCDHEINAFKTKAEVARANGKLGGRRPRTQPVISGLAKGTQALANQEPRTKNQIPPKPPRGEGRFPDFWNAWPLTDRRQDRKKCFAKWSRSGFDARADEIIAHVEVLKRSKKWLDGYEPAPLTYLNGERWLDGAEVSGKAAFEGAI